jgi:hypothetical protein
MRYESPCRELFHGLLQRVKSIDAKLNIDEPGPSTSQIALVDEIEVLSDDVIYDEPIKDGMIPMIALY